MYFRNIALIITSMNDLSQTHQQVITLSVLKDFYLSHKDVLEKGPRILSDNRMYINPTEMIRQQESGENHYYVW